jgi:hypothetical protein
VRIDSDRTAVVSPRVPSRADLDEGHVHRRRLVAATGRVKERRDEIDLGDIFTREVWLEL